MAQKKIEKHSEDIIKKETKKSIAPEKDPNCIEYWQSIDIPVNYRREPTLEENIARAHSMLPWCFKELPKGCKRDRTYFMEEVIKYLTIELNQLAETIQAVEQEYSKIILEITKEVA